ncbi:hypothetical protein AJ80_00381 [Polytolypa hystricis UAMH7299]|uniref:C2H2-type domain-containing protein n=1 Tax=Polytolypa hystricis (strain UAMH7299) TaxID=1447883 RepID=A0A2B7Z393_POLH7|nr:hypothetical protein AJ80_00381 [Polytolypa hystricis UAMH7299]
MAGPVNPGSEPVSLASPLSQATPSPLFSPSSAIAPSSSSLLKSTDSRPGPSLSSIASAGLRTSPSPVSAKARLSPPSMATTAPADRPRQEPERDAVSTHNSNLQTARDALGAVMDVSSERKDATEPTAPPTVAEPAEKSANVPSGGVRSPNHHQRASSMVIAEGFTIGDNAGTTTLMNRATVASPGPMEENNPMEGERPHRREDEIMLEEGNKSFSYPVPMGATNVNDPRRGMSLPHTGYNKGSPRSPSAKKHRCPYCSTEFTRHHNLKSHLLTHSQEKPYVCQTCQSRFRRLHDLKRHAKLHTGERPHICPKCGRRFARGDALARHNKGAGGCAGRRSSMGSFLGEDEYGDGGGTGGPDDGMEGLMYTEPERMDEEEEKRLNMPRIARHDPPPSELPHKTPHGHIYQPHQSSTYPPLAANRSSQGGLFPPVRSHPSSNSSTSPISQTGNLPFPTTGGSGSSSLNPPSQQQRGSSPSVFAQANMTESPKPLSPNVIPSHQLNSHGPEGNAQHSSRGHSPGVKPLQPQPYGRDSHAGPPGSAVAPVSSGASHTSLPAQGTLGLPPPHQIGAPQLPLPHGLNSPDARFTLHSQGAAGGQSQQHHHQPHPSTSSSSSPSIQPGSASRHHTSTMTLTLSPPILAHHAHRTPPADITINANSKSNSNNNNKLYAHQRQLSTTSNGNNNPPAPNAIPMDGIWRHVRALEDRVNGLEDEVLRLRSQLAASSAVPGPGGAGGNSGSTVRTENVPNGS